MVVGDLAIIVGNGEIGSALAEVLGTVHDLTVVDIVRNTTPRTVGCDFMHICFPYETVAGDFVGEVRRYARAYKPQTIVIHSTVKPGTSRQCGATHSPVVGIHPYLVESLRTFKKMIGGTSAGRVAQHFMAAGMRGQLYPEPEITEWMKILSTTYYGLQIAWAQHVNEIAEMENLPFGAWREWTENYNAGYAALGRPEYVRPTIQPIKGPIGGHCIQKNLELLHHTDPFAELIMDLSGGAVKDE